MFWWFTKIFNITFSVNYGNIDWQSFSFVTGDNVTIVEVVETMKDSGVYIFVIISYELDFEMVTAAIISLGMDGCTYYYWCVDVWTFHCSVLLLMIVGKYY